MPNNRFLTSQSTADSLFAELRLRVPAGYVKHVGDSAPTVMSNLSTHKNAFELSITNAELGFASYEGAMHVRRLLADPQFRHFVSVQCQKLDRDTSTVNGATTYNAEELQVQNALLQGRKEMLFAFLKQPFNWQETNPDVGHSN